ncbi:MAG: elongation factor Ts [Tidjanibacter sp.]|nr:elongation factor Ts [Rikenellaceae bacterium]MBQ8335139.1 elongation factor Ts [Tidjanibacter sp.]
MAVTLAEIKKLRDMTQAGMMDCKKALEEANGDMQRAIEIIREKGKLVASKRADRTATEGVVVAKVAGGKAYLVCLACETDFVAQVESFGATAETIAEIAAQNNAANLEALLACPTADGRTVADLVTEKTGQTGEKVEVPFYACIDAPYCATYVHFNKKLGAIVGFNKEISEELAKGIAMQVVSMNPVAVSAAMVPQSVIDEETNIAIQKTKDELVQKAVDAALSKAGINPAHVDSEDHIESNQSKGWITAEQAEQAREIIKTVSAEKAANLPAQMVENIAKGRLQKFFKEQTLEEQAYQMGDGKTSVKDVLKAADAEAKIVSFYRVSLCD